MEIRENKRETVRQKTCHAAVFLSILLFVLLLSGCGERLQKVREYRRAGISAMESGEYAAAAEAFRHAMDYYGTAKQDSTETDILRYLAEAEFRAGSYDAAAEDYQRLLRSDQRQPEYLDMAAVCTAKSGGSLPDAVLLYEEAMEKLQQKGKSLPEYHLSALYILGEALAEAGDPALSEEALRLYNEAAVAAEATPELCARIGKLWFAAGKTEDAREAFTQGLALTEQIADRREADGKEQGEKGQGGEAQDGEVVPEQDIRRDLQFSLAVCSEYEGDFEGALQQMEALAAEYGEDDVLRHELLFLRSRVRDEEGAE
ncbi:MAG: tetratricopeptide repeat protein [Stomatobaculum sp.]